MYACMCMCVQGFRLCRHPRSHSNGFPGNSCQEASETPVKRCRRLFTALNPVTCLCKTKRDMEGRESCFRFSHERQEVCGVNVRVKKNNIQMLLVTSS